ncbi:hypothetical protein Sme01_32600 [Sphaerisporangium melleum]|uniref:Uncharacterized protein n=1 Tax=Sphaerisporangium melleum TaxID=321316 RepID=A0A917RIH6_9ACTN|nr:hypothetical protein [Sphaerisporangium melleum]GGL10035.1 hypothetical protein GCM10007964_60290 [Sphaerisporangium melleum]GII70784.1 hypothetical protein Sme01_32600 [Sphaerisporangium melleum]
MSKERARRRAQREAEKARQAAVRAAREARRARWRRMRARVTAAVPRPVRVARQGGLIARRHRAQNAVMALLFVLVQAGSWLLLSTWAARLGALVLSLLLLPVLVTVLFDRRS